MDIVTYTLLKKKIGDISAFETKGSVASSSALPESADPGDLYITEDTGYTYVWDGEDWIHVNQGPGIDDTLAISGKAADAKATGDALASQSEKIAPLTKSKFIHPTYYDKLHTGDLARTKYASRFISVTGNVIHQEYSAGSAARVFVNLFGTSSRVGTGSDTYETLPVTAAMLDAIENITSGKTTIKTYTTVTYRGSTSSSSLAIIYYKYANSTYTFLSRQNIQLVTNSSTIGETFNSMIFDVPSGATHYGVFYVSSAAISTFDSIVMFDAVAEDKPSLSILFVGNSLAYDSVQYAPAILKSIGVDANLDIGILYLGGQSLDMHYEHFVDNDAVYTLTESRNLEPWANVLTSATGYDIINYRNWDVISFQQASTKAGNYNTFQPYLTNLIEYICNNVSYKWKMAWNNVHSTSAGCDPDDPDYNPDPDPPTNPPEASHETTEANYTKVISALEDMLEENPVQIVFPVATATQNARNTSLGSLGTNGELLYDWKHAQEGIACQIEGYTVAIKLMELLGINNKSIINDNTVIGTTFLSDWNIQGQHGSPVGSTNDATGVANRRIAQKCAIMACQRPMELSNILVPTTT